MLLTLPVVIALFACNTMVMDIIAILWVAAMAVAGGAAMLLDTRRVPPGRGLTSGGTNVAWLGLLAVAAGQSSAHSELPMADTEHLWGWFVTGVGLGMSTWAALMLPFLASLRGATPVGGEAAPRGGLGGSHGARVQVTCPVCRAEAAVGRGVAHRWRLSILAATALALTDVWGLGIARGAGPESGPATALFALGVVAVLRCLLIYGLIWPELVHALHTRRMSMRLFVLVVVALMPGNWIAGVMRRSGW